MRFNFFKKSADADMKAPQEQEKAERTEDRVSPPLGDVLPPPGQPGPAASVRVHNLVILDESGSMGYIRQQALSGVNETIQTIRAAQEQNPEVAQSITLVTFAGRGYEPMSNLHFIFDDVKVENARELDMKDYGPSGNTPLYDAIGISVLRLQEQVKDGEGVLVTIITDGLENSSRRFSRQQIAQMIDGLKGKGWVFTFIGANQDSAEVAGSMGISHAMDFCQDAEGTEMMFHKMESSRNAYYKKMDMMRQGITVDIHEDFFHERDSLRRVSEEHLNDETLIRVNGTAFVEGGACGPQGQEYLIPVRGDENDLRSAVEMFRYYADRHQDMRFLVLHDGFAAQGQSEVRMARLFACCLGLPNVCLPAAYWNVIKYKYSGR